MSRVWWSKSSHLSYPYLGGFKPDISICYYEPNKSNGKSGGAGRVLGYDPYPVDKYKTGDAFQITSDAGLSIFDLPNQRVIKAQKNSSLEIPENAVVVPGSRPAKGEFAKAYNLNINTAVIIKYNNNKHEKTKLEDSLRS